MRHIFRAQTKLAAPAALCFYVMALGVFAYALQEFFYSRYGGFYDSISYYRTMAHVLAIAERDGSFQALAIVSKQTTVFLPWIETVLLQPWVPVARWVAILVQIPWVLLFALITYAYHRQVSGASRRLAVVLAVTAIGFAGMFDYNGGLPDFRMDLLQALFFGIIVTGFLIARRAGTMGSFVVLGVLVGLGFLARATLPVYVLIFALPVIVFDIATGVESRWQIARRYLVAVVVSVAIYGPYFWRNFDFIYYYYVVWNTAANENLPVSESARHITYALEGIGTVLIVGLLAFAALRLATLNWRGARLNWIALWAGAAPLAYLVLSGSGMNPFVDLVAVPGIMLFLTSPIVEAVSDSGKPNPLPPPIWQRVAPIGEIILGFALLLTALGGVTKTASGVVPWMAEATGIEAVVQTVLDNVPQDGGSSPTNVAVSFIGGMAFNSIADSLIFSRGFSALLPGCVVQGQTEICAIKMAPAAQAEWNELPGSNEGEKLASIARSANESVDVLVVPSGDISDNGWRINQLQDDLKSLLYRNGQWRTIAEGVRINDQENVDVLVNLAGPAARYTEDP